MPTVLPLTTTVGTLLPPTPTTLVHIFLAFYRSGGMNNGPPPPQEPGFHPGDQPFAPNVAIPRFPVPAIV